MPNTNLEKLVIGSLVACISVAIGGNILTTIGAGLGVNWASEGLGAFWQEARTSQLEPGSAITRAYEKALQRSIVSLRQQYEVQYGKQRDTRVFDLLQTCARSVADAEYPPGVTSSETAKQALASNLNNLLHGHDERQVDWIQQRLLGSVAASFKDELARDDEAWRRFHGWLLQQMHQKIGALSTKLENTDVILDRMSDPTVFKNVVDKSLELVVAQLDNLQIELRRLAQRPQQTSTTCIVINATTIQQVQLEHRWVRPLPLPIRGDVVERRQDIRAVEKKLKTRRGTVRTSNSIAIQGMAGVGKTTLAALVVSVVEEAYHGGVLWEEIGSGVSSPEHVNPVLNRWASFAFGGQQKEGYQFTPDAVRALLGQQGVVLVVLDDVWRLDVVQPLLNALPDGAHLLITTRSQRVADELRGQVHNLDVLSRTEALNLIKLRLNRKRRMTKAEEPWMQMLAESVGRHALALDVAAASLLRWKPEQWPEKVQLIAADVQHGTGFGELPLVAREQREQKVETALRFSYDALPPETQQQFRKLGAFAPDAPFTTAAVTALWNCDINEADGQLNLFVEAALLAPSTADSWRQHSLLRAYALALLQQRDEYNFAAAAHTAFYNSTMEQADEFQRPHDMLPAMPQVGHAFAWAVEHDLERAFCLITNSITANEIFGRLHESNDWCEAALIAARKRGDRALVARALNLYGNAIFKVAKLPEEDRKGRLYEALAAYDEALHYFQPDIAPLDYARVQRNRGNTIANLAEVLEEDRKGRLYEALAAYDEALRFYQPDIAPLDYAQTQCNRALTFAALAEVPEEDRKGRLYEALAAYDEALRFRRPDNAPFDYANTMFNRANALGGLHNLSGEDHKGRLHEALAAYDEALRFLHPHSTPLDYAKVQNSRAFLITFSSMLHHEDRKGRLYEALAASDEALRFLQPDTTPHDYADTMYKRAMLVAYLAEVPGENRKGRFYDALVAYGEALRVWRPDNAPLDYARVQNARATILALLTFLPEEDRKGRLYEALAAYDEALRFWRLDTAPCDYAKAQQGKARTFLVFASISIEERVVYLTESAKAAWTAFTVFDQLRCEDLCQQVQRELHLLRKMCGAEFNSLWDTLGVGPCPVWLLEQHPAKQGDA